MNNKFELRWLEKETGKTLMDEWGYYYQETVKILQYRNKTTVTDYSYTNPDTGDYDQKQSWSEWIDVPIMEEKYDYIT